MVFNLFKKTKKEKVKPQRVEKIEKPKKVAEQPKPRKVEVAARKPKKISGQAYGILRKPHVTEKATDLTAQNQYVFEVFPTSNKNQVKIAVEDVYGVDIKQVRIINIPRRRRRLGKIQGWQSGYKKAVVTLKEGQKIEILPR